MRCTACNKKITMDDITLLPNGKELWLCRKCRGVGDEDKQYRYHLSTREGADVKEGILDRNCETEEDIRKELELEATAFLNAHCGKWEKRWKGDY